ncbi:MAG: hypothetical protein V3R80_00415 [Candidatus Tectomicrobia bacterium]
MPGWLLAMLFWGSGQLYPYVFLTEWAYWGGVKGIKVVSGFGSTSERWRFGTARGVPGG